MRSMPIPALPTLALLAVSACASPQRAPEAAPGDVTDTYHGTVVHDPYRWLEKGDAPEVKAFIDDQNAHARRFLDALPQRAAIAARLRTILGAETVAYSAPEEVMGQLFALKLQPPKQQRMLVVMPSPEAPDKERAVVDPNALDPNGKTAIDWYRVAPDGKRVAVSMSSGGSETGDVHVFDVATGHELEVVPGVNAGTAGGDLAWLPDGQSFLYTRYPRGDERAADDKLFYVQLYRHTLGTSTLLDSYELGKDFPRIAEVFADVDQNGDLLCTIQKGDGGEFELYLKRKGASAWTRIAAFEDKVVQGFFGPRDDLYLISRKDAPRGALLRGPRAGFQLAKARVVVAQGADALVSDIWARHALTIEGGRLYLTYQLGGPSEIRVFDLDGHALGAADRPTQIPISAAGEVVPLGKSDVLFADTSFLEPLGWYRFDTVHRATTKTALSSKTPVDLSGVTVLRELATSRDGTLVPVNILLPKGVAKGTPIPFVVTGYGGYGVNVEPSFQGLRSVFLDHGVGLAVLNLRGGGELGEDWHAAGALTHKQNVFDDFIASVEHLVAARYAIPGKVGIMGGSNGGLLMGAVLTQRPDLFAAVSSYVGIYDMLRVETEPNGAFNTTEFGTVADPAQFAALYAYSPYHHVKDGAAYPPTLFLVGANDVRVAPWHSRKMAARLQAASDAAPHLLVTSFGAGHGIGSSLDQLVAQNTDGFSFLLHYVQGP